MIIVVLFLLFLLLMGLLMMVYILYVACVRRPLAIIINLEVVAIVAVVHIQCQEPFDSLFDSTKFG